MPKKTILVVDQERPLRLTFEAILARAGYHVTAVGEAAAAVELLRAVRFDLILADIADPERGPAARILQHLQAAGDQTPLVVIDGDPQGVAAARCFSMGACYYLVKPVHREELLWVVRKILEGVDDAPR